MHRTNPHALDADRHWEMGRREDRRESVRLSNGLHDIEEARQYHINSMAKEKKRIQQDLMKIKQAKTFPPGSGSEFTRKQRLGWGGLHTTTAGKDVAGSTAVVGERSPTDSTSNTNELEAGPGTSLSLQTRINDFMGVVGSSKIKTPSSTLDSASNLEPPTKDCDEMVEVKKLMAHKMTISAKPTLQGQSSKGTSHTDARIADASRPDFDTTTATSENKHSGKQTSPGKQRRTSIPADPLILDEEAYAPDGYLRTMHTMPDLEESMEEAKKARYIRHRVNPEWNKELTVEQIFEKNQGSGSSETPSKDSSKEDQV
ncbi:coiled-coil domain-containing protein 190 [Ambystoma mexicanum]|uniref:coiled-coil domain-containing protein 190 n=1 Tax=Ambystoma mexicanum TaxID=8296 RepID=UPI0037E96B99